MNTPPVLACESLVKEYGTTRVVDNVSVRVQKGEILALLGENGAGKSTLVKMLSGIVQPESGTLNIDGRPVVLADARAAARAGVHLVHQELALLPEQSVTENIFLGQELRSRSGLLDWRAMRRRAKAALNQLGVRFSVDARVRDLTTAGQQMVEIARASVGESRVVILDEPTAALSPADADRLFAVVREMRDRGVAFIYISHRLDEVKALADTIVVLKDGKFVATRPCSEVSVSDMVAFMVGRELGEFFPNVVPNPHIRDVPAIEVRGLIDPPLVKEASFSLYPGEVVGLYGLEGHGQDEVLACLSGARAPYAGTLYVSGQKRKWQSIGGSIASGFGYVPEDRKTEGLILDFSGIRNISLPILRRRLSKWGIVSNRNEGKHTASAAMDSGIRGDLTRPVSALSGGNQQKVVLARWLAAESDVLLLNQPTRGVDVGAKAEIYRLVRELCLERGIVAFVVSREISELLGFCDRVLVMSSGRLAGEHSREATEAEILATAVGERHE